MSAKAIAAPIQTLLDLFTTLLADVRFADVDGQTLARYAAEVEAHTAKKRAEFEARQKEVDSRRVKRAEIIKAEQDAADERSGAAERRRQEEEERRKREAEEAKRREAEEAKAREEAAKRAAEEAERKRLEAMVLPLSISRIYIYIYVYPMSLF